MPLNPWECTFSNNPSPNLTVCKSPHKCTITMRHDLVLLKNQSCTKEKHCLFLVAAPHIRYSVLQVMATMNPVCVLYACQPYCTPVHNLSTNKYQGQRHFYLFMLYWQKGVTIGTQHHLPNPPMKGPTRPKDSSQGSQHHIDSRTLLL